MSTVLFLDSSRQMALAPLPPNESLPEIGDLNKADQLPYPTVIQIERIRLPGGSGRAVGQGKAYSATELDQIMLKLFGFKVKATKGGKAGGKESAVAFLHQPESIRKIARNNERVQDAKRIAAYRDIRSQRERENNEDWTD